MPREWLAEFQDDDNVHVIPLDDLQSHDPTANCDCGPECQRVENSIREIIVHNSYDHRELN